MPPNAIPARVRATAAAMDLLHRLRTTHGPLMLHQSGGCCDGSAPMCYPAGEFRIGDRDVLLGLLDLRLRAGDMPAAAVEPEDAVPVWISGPQFAAWRHTQLVLDVVPGRGSGFSLEAPEGCRFLSRARVFSPAELENLAAQEPLTGADWASGRRPDPPSEPQVVTEAADACPVPGGR
ncbi:DUF779 domain-containing protein [Nocardia huaxiensis]|uniref:DUF779 domain-containing protein n=1 Tax=Nocardia huaxiensis TaxID=2755382 RepID=A0A7D6Z662_9NOCA|nr:DUF779 domain-containing protein [Nocardia huaxiensis]QLY32524.1 DUF779 domain-containing protein [Nocardia huaxiensis]UFS93763.1 DUF779 domain-containing protein [Nocardia huaxiensis]